ncbi:flavin monoamine oxidase family protein [Kribbella speibonae]|nr:FAD-dependent oxidoreductase [Kribbella speibonae]
MLPKRSREPRRGGPVPSRINADVAVVGAGISGLVAARHLHQAGVDVCVVEASDRVGGRLLNAEVAPGIELEVGGRYIGGEEHVRALVEELGAKTFDHYTWGGDTVWHLGGVRTVGGDLPMSEASRHSYKQAIADLDALAAQVSPREPWNAPAAAMLDQVTFESWLLEHVPDERARWAVLLDLIIAFVTPPWRVSLLHVAATIAAKGGVATDLGPVRIVGGGSGLCQTMAEELGERAHVGSPVERIEWGAGGVTVHSRDVVLRCRQAVVAMSPADAHWISYEPGLPWDRDQFHRHFQMGSGVISLLVYGTPFWREEGLSGAAATDLPAGGHIDDSSPEDGSIGVLNSFVCPLPEGVPWEPRGERSTRPSFAGRR